MCDTNKTSAPGGEFSVGEEVRNVHGTTSIIVGFTEKREPVLCFANSETKRPSFYVYDEYERAFSPIKKTGKIYEGFAEILMHMTNGQQLSSDQSQMGRWITVDPVYGLAPYFCSKCGKRFEPGLSITDFHFCPSCGIKMKAMK